MVVSGGHIFFKPFFLCERLAVASLVLFSPVGVLPSSHVGEIHVCTCSLKGRYTFCNYSKQILT